MVSLIGVIIALVLVGLVLYLVNLIPMDITIKKTIHLVVMIVVVIWLLQIFGILGSLSNIGIR